jgi:NAD(P)H-nitrite reductase large subunit
MEDKIICNCLKVSEHEIVDAIKNKGAVMLQDIMDITGAGTGCGSCVDDIDEILKRELAK